MAIPRNLANIAPHVNASSTELVINDAGANLDFRVEGDTNANLLFADAGAEKVGFGTTTFNTNGGVIQVSNGISFPATQSACSDVNTLDDYEEGTWTPSGDFSISNGTRTNVDNRGTYTKVGRMVTVNFYTQVTKGTASGDYKITGLPFAQSSGMDGGVGGFATNMTGVSGGIVGSIPQNSSAIELHFTGTGATSKITEAQLGASNAVFAGSVSYFI